MSNGDRLFNGGEKRIFWKQWIYDWIYDRTDVPPINAPTFGGVAFHFQDLGLFRRLINKLFGIDRIRKSKILHVKVLTILDRICEVIRNKNVAEMQESSLLKAAIFKAAETENVVLIRRIFGANEGISEITNGKDRIVLQFAADYRLGKVCNLIRDEYRRAWFIGSRRDKFDNNIYLSLYIKRRRFFTVPMNSEATVLPFSF